MRDTSPKAAEVQAHILRGLAAERRLELAVDMSLTARSLLRGRLRAEHPDWPEKRVAREVLRLCYPDLDPRIDPE